MITNLEQKIIDAFRTVIHTVLTDALSEPKKPADKLQKKPKNSSLDKEIYKTIKSGFHKLSDIMRVTGVNRNAVKNTLKRLKQNGRVRVVGNRRTGKWFTKVGVIEVNAETIHDYMSANPDKLVSRWDIVNYVGLTEHQFSAAMRFLEKQKRVVRSGANATTRYKLKK